MSNNHNGDTMTITTEPKASSPEAIKPKSNTERKHARRRLRAALVAGAGLVVATGVTLAFTKGEESGKHSRDPEVTRQAKLNHAQDWLLDRGILPIANEGVSLDQTDTVVVRLQPGECKQPVSVTFADEALHLTQQDAEGHIYGNLVMKNAVETQSVLKDICT